MTKYCIKNKDQDKTTQTWEQLSTINQQHNHTLQTNPRHREEEPHRIYSN